MAEDERIAVRREKNERKMERKMVKEGEPGEEEAPVQGMVDGTMVAS